MVDAAVGAPNLASTLNQGAFNLGNASGAWIGGAAITLGVGYVDLPWIAAALALVALGLSALIVASPQAFLALKIGGALYLVWLAFQAIRHGSAFSPETGGRAPRSLARNWATGLGINLLNPKIILFFMTFLPQFVSAHDAHAPGKLFFLGLMFIVLSLPFTASMVIAADRFAALLKGSPRLTRVTDYLFAGVFSAFALKILTTQAK